MSTRFRIAFGLALLVSILIVIPAFAGGWAVITLDELPSNVVAGEPLTIGFTVLQHGRTPMTGLYPTVSANLSGAQEFVVNAEPEGEAGHYTATLNFPVEGEWGWSIQAFAMDQTMPMLSVMAPGASIAVPVVTKAESSPALSVITWLSVAALAVGLLGAVISFRSRNRQVMGLTAISLLAGVTLLIVGAGRASAVDAQARSESDAAKATSISEVEYGRQLFIAKGCITCHSNSRAGSSSEYWTIDIGAPDLSKFSADPEILYTRLKDPASVKSDTKMPDLGLKKDEIEALVAFINSR